jgi:hypothetical protein
MLAARITIRKSCPKHRLFNPSKHGEETIRGGCAECYQLLAVRKTIESFVADLKRQGVEARIIT